MTRTAVLAATLVLFAGCVDRAVAPVSVVPRTRFLVTVEHGTFGPTLESRLETELLLALMHQPDLEIVSAFVAERSILRQRTCDPGDREFVPCRARQLKLTGDFVVELQMGVVPGTWALTTSMKLGEGEPSWLPTLPFSQRSGESLEDAVARAARQLGASLGPTGIRPTASISAARPSPGDSTEISRLCADFNDPRASTGQLAWQLAASVRAHLHETDKDALLGSVLTELTEAPKAAGTDCGKLTALVAWQQRAVARGFLPAELKSETWRGNVEIQLSGPNVALPVWPDVGGSLAGAFAAKGFTLKSVGPCPEACAEGVDCIDGVSVSGVGPRLLLVVAAVDWSDGKVKVVGRAFMPDGAGGIRAVPMRKIEVVGVAALKPAVDAVVADLLK